VFKRRALEIHQAFVNTYPDLELVLNNSVPRKGSFELTLINSDGVETLLWSGIKRGPPRREKFPDPDSLMAELKKSLA